MQITCQDPQGQCIATGGSPSTYCTWDVTTDGCWARDWDINTGTNSLVVPECFYTSLTKPVEGLRGGVEGEPSGVGEGVVPAGEGVNCIVPFLENNFLVSRLLRLRSTSIQS